MREEGCKQSASQRSLLATGLFPMSIPESLAKEATAWQHQQPHSIMKMLANVVQMGSLQKPDDHGLLATHAQPQAWLVPLAKPERIQVCIDSQTWPMGISTLKQQTSMSNACTNAAWPA